MTEEHERRQLDRLLDGDLSESERQETLASLEQNPEAVDWLAERAILHASLRCSMRRRGLERDVTPTAPMLRTHSRRWVTGLAVAASAVIVMALFSFWLAADGDSVAWITSVSADDETRFQIGDQLEVGRRIEIETGQIVIEFQNGAITTLTGPCVFEIESATQAFLERGRVHTLAERPEAKGFTIRTLRGRVVDLGTEFVTSVAKDGHNRVDVTSGEVVVHLSGSTAQHHVRRGEMLAIEPGERQVTVRIERGDETPEFRFATIEPPSREDYADASRGIASVSLREGELSVHSSNRLADSGPVENLLDGVAQRGADVPNDSVFFRNGVEGSFLLDLGTAISVRKVNCYTWHQNGAFPENRVRAVQKFTVWGFAADDLPEGEPSAEAGWVCIARVNTDAYFQVGNPLERPAQQASSIEALHGQLGPFRYLLFAVEPTPSLGRSGIPNHTFFGEIDVYAGH